jgi:RNA polymerase sigma factor (sigma-70 family)
VDLEDAETAVDEPVARPVLRAVPAPEPTAASEPGTDAGPEPGADPGPAPDAGPEPAAAPDAGPEPAVEPASDDDPAQAPDLAPAPARAFEQAYEEHYPRMVRVAHMLTGSNEVAEDVVQDAFVGLFRRFESVDDPGGYLYRSVVNGCGARHRHRLVVRKVRHLVAATDVAPGEIDVTRQALARLSPRRRAVIVLRFYADLPLAEIGEVMGCSTGTVKSMLHRALAELKGVIDR